MGCYSKLVNEWLLEGKEEDLEVCSRSAMQESRRIVPLNGCMNHDKIVALVGPRPKQR